MNVSLPFGQSARRASILVVDDEPDVANLFRQQFRREARQGTYVMHFASSDAEVLDLLADTPGVISLIMFLLFAVMPTLVTLLTRGRIGAIT